jgi:ATP-dependent protease HslVU (ClpYQ) peptidase subunit
MAADSMVTVYDRPVLGSARKIRRYQLGDGSEVLVGISGDGAVATVLDADLQLADIDPHPDDLDRWANEVTRKASAICVASGVSEQGHMDAMLIIGYAGRLWSATHCYAIPHPDGIAAVGSGEGPAIGAMDALLACCPDMPPSQVVARAVSVAIERDKHSGGTIWMEMLPAAGGVAAANER